jgi:hypothetical protein
MTDRELLELAAQAAGLEFDPTVKAAHGLMVVRDGAVCQSDQVLWNPLTDDGDALRLAVQLSLWIGQHDDGVTVSDLYARINHEGVEENFNNDPCAATRRAIVRAAAEIGKETNT